MIGGMQFAEIYLHTYKLESGHFFCYYFTKMLGIIAPLLLHGKRAV